MLYTKNDKQNKYKMNISMIKKKHLFIKITIKSYNTKSMCKSHKKTVFIRTKKIFIQQGCLTF